MGSRNNIVISELALRGEFQEDFTSISLGDGNEIETLGALTFSEGLFDKGLSGRVVLNDPNPDVGSLASVLKQGSFIRFSFSTVDDLDNVHAVTNLVFFIYNVGYVADLGPGVIKNNATSQSISYRVDFASYESTSLEYESIDFLGEDYVGRIDELVSRLGDLYLRPEAEHVTAQVPLEITPTYNGLWLKDIQSLYPWGKEKQSGSLMQLINSVADCAVPVIGMEFGEEGDIVERGVPEDLNPSYVFYQSLPHGQWHFKPICGSFGFFNNLKEGTEGNGFHTYSLSNDETVYKRINQFKIETTGDLLDLQSSGAFGCHYTLIEPNWLGIYNNVFADCEPEFPDETTDDESGEGEGSGGTEGGGEEEGGREGFQGINRAFAAAENESGLSANPIETLNKLGGVNAYYHDAMSLATHLVKRDLTYEYMTDFFDQETGEHIGPLFGGSPISPNRTTASSGFSGEGPITNQQLLSNPRFSSIDDVIYGYFDQRYLNKPFPTDNDDYCSARNEKYMWQTMFDMTDLPLYSNSENGTVGIYEVVNDIRKPCRKGKHAYSVLADLKEQWNRYRYSVCCSGQDNAGGEFYAMLVGFTAQNDPDKDYIPYGLSGATIDNFFRYSFLEVEVWPKELVVKGVSATDFIPGLSGTVHEDKTYFEYLSAIDINPSTGGPHSVFINGHGLTGITFQFGLSANNSSGQGYKINQEQELFVIPVTNGQRGMFTAYNTNELLNNKAFTNAGINIKGYSYPQEFGLMPIGGMTVGVTDESTPLPQTYMGSIVSMRGLVKEGLSTIVSDAIRLSLPNEESEEESEEKSDVYTGPDLEGTPCNRVVGLLNQIVGTENLPTTFCGSTLDISYQNLVGEYIPIERDDIDIRSCILTNAPSKSQDISGGLSGEADNVVYLFSAENDHDGRC